MSCMGSGGRRRERHLLSKNIQARLCATAGLCLTLSSMAASLAQGAPHASFSRARIVSIARLVTAFMTEQPVPGFSIAVVTDGRLAWSKGYGMADLENHVQATDSTAYRSASIGKTMTATAAMELV